MKRPGLIICILYTFIFSSCGGNKAAAPDQKRQDSIYRNREQVVALAEIQPEKKIISLFAQTSGSVAEVYHDIGDTVQRGELIARLNNSVEDAQLRQATSKLYTQQAVIAANQSQLTSLDIKAANAEENYNRNAELIKSGGVTRQALNDSRYVMLSGRSDVSAAAATVKQSTAKLSELQRDIAYATSVLNQKQIRAPYNGTVLSLDLKVGNSINANQALGNFAPAGRTIAIAEVDELYANQIRLGMTAYIRPQGRNDTLATGKVFLVSPYLNKKSLFSDDAANMEDRRVREVRVLLNKNSHVLIGNRVDCIIKIK